MASEDINWMVPLRRAVVKKAIKYRDFLADWLDQLRHADNAFVLGIWYNDPEGKEFAPADYDRGIVALRRWLKMTFDDGYKIVTNPVGVTTVQTYVPNFHARLWKGPKRVLLEQRAKDDPSKLAEIQTFDLEGGRLALQLDEQGKPRPIELLPGDVLEIALHEFLVACGQKRFEDIEFDPVGSFYLGTTVRSKTGRKRVELPLLHDNMLAMRFQLLTALNMANCYHDTPVYSEEYRSEIPASQLRPEGGGVYSRGMPYGGNASAKVEVSPSTNFPKYWLISQNNTNQPEVERPIYVPVYNHLLRYADDLPLTWGWTCTPFTLFFFNMIADVHESSNGIVFPGKFRGESLAMSLCLSTSAKNNGIQLGKVHEFQKDKRVNDDPLLLHRLQLSDVVLPREQPPLADLCEIVFPEDRGPPEGRPFTDPDGDRIRKLPLPVGKAIDTHDWNDLCPDASVVVVSSADGHEYGLVKLYKADKILADAVSALSEASATREVHPPLAGRMSGYNPMTGEDYATDEGILPDGHFFIYESSASLVPKGRESYYSLKLGEVKIHKFKPTPANKARFRMSGGKKDKELQIDDDGGNFRSKAVSGIFYIREGVEGENDPRTMADIYGIRRESWTAIGLKFSSSAASKEAKRLLVALDALYGERAVPFPTLLEVASGLPSRARVAEQLQNHRRRLIELGRDDAKQRVEAELAITSYTPDKKKLQGDLKLIEEDEHGVRKHEKLRKALIVLSGPVVGLDLESYEDESE